MEGDPQKVVENVLGARVQSTKDKYCPQCKLTQHKGLYCDDCGIKLLKVRVYS